ncbi:gamma-glutamyltransferase [Alkalicoccus daliensis]|uniref:Gamma-glutamyltranspeptidase / glutathione hydrolase n=1 Tax=Alkalicoccus daliensis TaxID=745820 RepID=A0A1H0HFM9_9BACI|nr:gamma-glutamyltransferase [Alkalicoccus daliensis]SDO17863.1 gamma-glutamyltranspeptidase / glutathione hydrolase [Alkalicoccus daliensis]
MCSMYINHGNYALPPKKFIVSIPILFIMLIGCAPEDNAENSPAENQNNPEENTENQQEEVNNNISQNEEENNKMNSTEEEEEQTASYGVSAGHPDAVDAGMEVLEAGGSAVDAAIAAAYAVSVVEPFASGIGGGGVTLVHEQGEAPEAYDYREVVPQEGIPASNIGVPGFVAGTMELHEDYGTAAWETLLDPAITLAESAEVSSLLAQQLQSGQTRLPVEQLDHFYPERTPLEAGAALEQQALAEVLTEIRDTNGASFYEGEAAETLAAAVEGIDTASLESFEVGRHDPAAGSFLDYEIIAAPPPLPGISVIQMLQMLEDREIMDMERNSTEFIHNTAMSWRIAREFIETDLGDPAFTEVPVAELTDPERNAAIGEQISTDSLLQAEEGTPYGGFDPNTTHITVVDDEGTVVSMTNTLTNFWGSGEYTDGFFLNNQMARFSIGNGGNNEPEPGRRSVTWSSPMIVADDEGPVLGIGSPGGERIPIMLTQVIADWAGSGTDLETAVQELRFQLEDDTLIMEEPPGPEQADELLSIGYSEILDPPTPLYFGSMQVLEFDRESGEIIGTADPRREGAWRVEERE